MSTHVIHEYRQKVNKVNAAATRLASIIEQATVLRDRHDLQNLREDLRQAAGRLSTDQLTISVVATFSAGKSHFLNALVFGEQVLESTSAETTFKQFTVAYGEAPALQYLDTRTGELVNEIVPLDNLKERIKALNEDSNPAVGRNHYGRTVLVKFPNEILQQGLTLIDTPGLNSLNEGAVLSHVVEALEKSDAVIFITDASQGINASDFKIWDEMFRRIPESKRWVLLNKIDLWDEDEDRDDEIARSKRYLIDKVYKGVEPTPTRIFPISAKEALRGKRDKSPSLLAASRLEAFQSSLFDAVTKDRYRDFIQPELMLIESLEQRLKAALDDQLKAVTSRLANFQTGAKENATAAQRLKNTLEVIASKKKALEGDAKTLKAAAKTGFKGLGKELGDEFDALLTQNLTAFGFWEMFNAQEQVTKILEKTAEEFKPVVEARAQEMSKTLEPHFRRLVEGYQDSLLTATNQLSRANIEIVLDDHSDFTGPELTVEDLEARVEAGFDVVGALISSIMQGVALDTLVTAIVGFIVKQIGTEVAKQVFGKLVTSGIPVIGIVIGVVSFLWSAGTAPDEIRKTVRQKAMPLIREKVEAAVAQAELDFNPTATRLEAAIQDRLTTVQKKLQDVHLMTKGQVDEITAQVKQLGDEKRQLEEVTRQLRSALAV